MDEGTFTLLPERAARLQQTLRELLTALDGFRPT